MNSLKPLKLKLKDFWLKNEQKIMLVLGFVLIAIISFEMGMIEGRKIDQKPLIIEKPIEPSKDTSKASEGQISLQNTASAKPSQLSKDCAYVGSKNSNKYHLPNCQWAKRIKPENTVCFKSVEDAVARGYQPDRGCIK